MAYTLEGSAAMLSPILHGGQKPPVTGLAYLANEDIWSAIDRHKMFVDYYMWSAVGKLPKLDRLDAYSRKYGER